MSTHPNQEAVGQEDHFQQTSWMPANKGYTDGHSLGKHQEGANLVTKAPKAKKKKKLFKNYLSNSTLCEVVFVAAYW